MDVAHDGDNQAAVGGHGHADIDPLVADQAVFGERHVDVGHLANGQRGGLHDHVVEGDLEPFVSSAFGNLLAQLDELDSVDGQGEEEVRNRTCALRHAAGYRA